MSNKPVAWIDEINTFVLDKDYKQFPKSLQNGMIPLYTHPAKTYEDAIEECAQRAEAYAYMSPNFTALAGELRAILKKASEK